MLACFALFACGADAPPDPPLPLAPSEGRRDALRVVALSALSSRFVVEIGAGDQLVGVDAASGALPGPDEVPVVSLADAAALSPDLVLVGRRSDQDDPLLRALTDRGIEVLEFAPHDLQDAILLCRDVGGRLIGDAAAHRFEIGMTRPLAEIAGASFGQAKPRVAAVVNLDPLEIAGAHSFETDLIQIAGGTSVTHDDDQPRLAVEANELTARFAPDLILVVTNDELDEVARRDARSRLPEAAEVAFFAYDRKAFWLHEPVEDARRLREILADVL